MRLVWLVVVVLGGCYAPAIPEGAPCTTTVECPAPLVCTQGACRATAVPDDANDDAAPPDDARPDAPPSDGAPACAPLVTGPFTNIARIGELYVQVQRASGSTDIEVLTRPAPTGPWGTPVKLGGVNTPGFDGDPFLSPDQRTLHYGTGATFTVLEIWQATR